MKKIITIVYLIGYAYVGITQNRLIDCTIEISKDTGISTRSNYCRTCNLWTNGQVPFEFNNNVTAENQARAIEVMNMLQTIANLRFIQRSNQGQFIRFQNSDRNNSFVGMQNSGNIINISDWDSPMVICHEIFHSLGFFHEHQRPDRDNYVRIVRERICAASFEANFLIENDVAVTSNIPYDFTSIMHYWSGAFRNCRIGAEPCNGSNSCPNGHINQNTIEVLPQFSAFQDRIGNSDNLSRNDALMLRFLYPFPNDRIVNIRQSAIGFFAIGANIRQAVRGFTTNYAEGTFVPNNANIWVMPGDYINAEGTYKKPITINAPFGGVILR